MTEEQGKDNNLNFHPEKIYWDKLIENSTQSKWHEKAEWRLKNRKWLKLSGRIALTILVTLREKGISKEAFSEKMEVPIKTVKTWLSGSYNFDIETITKIEDVLKIKILNICNYEK